MLYAYKSYSQNILYSKYDTKSKGGKEYTLQTWLQKEFMLSRIFFRHLLACLFLSFLAYFVNISSLHACAVLQLPAHGFTRMAEKAH